MKRILSIVLMVMGLVVISAVPGQASPNGAHGSPGNRGGAHVGSPAFSGHPGFSGHRGFADGRAFVGHPGFRRDGHGGVFVGVAPFAIGPAYPYGFAYDPGYAAAPPEYSEPAPSYWYYCQSAGAYYPDAPACPEPWVPVPAQ